VLITLMLAGVGSSHPGPKRHAVAPPRIRRNIDRLTADELADCEFEADEELALGEAAMAGIRVKRTT
jgi:hypothetical protein